MAKKAVFLDFDGVLFDTIKEAYCISLITGNMAKAIGSIKFDSKHFKLFKKYRFLIGCAQDYYYLLELIGAKMADKRIDVQKIFELRRNPESEGCRKFKKRFFGIRKYIKEKYPDYWLSLNKPYNFLYGIAGLIENNKDKFFIITTKDRETVLRLLNINKIGFKKDNIYDEKFYRKFNSKSHIIKFIKTRNFIKESIFVDDSKMHLRSCESIAGLDTVQAGWGYTSRSNGSSSEKEVLSKIKKFLEV
ncbi:MAG: hypothetical protein FJZ11_00060 [Candidatus Omnitrophica bacterium]|nr:hypothetical protein [Candidatus Omnitrophota bacterium]